MSLYTVPLGMIYGPGNVVANKTEPSDPGMVFHYSTQRSLGILRH